MRKKISATLFFLLSLCINPVVYSGDSSKKQHGAHVHGEAVLNLALEGKSVLVELQTPAANILGFEHQPATAEQRNAVDRAVQMLEKHATVFQFDAGACRQTSLEMESPFTDDGEDHHDDGHAHKHDHSHHHDHAHKHDHDAHHHDKTDSGHKESEHHKEHDSHSEFHIVYHLTCAKPQAISAVEVTVFKHFSGFETVRVQWVGASGQGMQKASQSQTRVSLKP